MSVVILKDSEDRFLCRYTLVFSTSFSREALQERDEKRENKEKESQDSMINVLEVLSLKLLKFTEEGWHFYAPS